MPATTRLLTAEEFAKLPDDDYRYELVEGKVIRMPPVKARHGAISISLGSALYQFVKKHRLGVVLSESGFKLTSNPDTVRGPDVSFIRANRIPATGLPDAYWTGPPDLAVEILSPDDRRSRVLSKIEQYLRVGVRMVWVVDPRNRTVTRYCPGSDPLTLFADQELDGGDVVPGFHLRISELFD